MPYLIQVIESDGRLELLDEESKSVRQATERLKAQMEPEDLADATVKIWTVTGGPKVYRLRATVAFDETVDE